MSSSEDTLSDAILAARLFPGGGEMGARIRQLDWSHTLLGPVRTWPQSLRTAVSIMLGSRFPMMVHWGPQLVHFYNDGYATILQSKHPGALGQPAEPWWREMWPFLLGIFEQVWQGQTTYFENSLVLPDRQGFIEETYFTFSHSPLYDETGAVGGIFVTALETTSTVLQQRRLEMLSHLTTDLVPVVRPEEAAQHIMAALATNQTDIPFALLYSQEGQAPHAYLRAWFGLPAGEPTAPITIALTSPVTGELGWPLAVALQQRTPLLVALATHFTDWPTGTWSEPPTQALLLPLEAVEAEGTSTVLIVGLSARRPLDTAYEAFLTLVADYAAQALTRAFALHEAQRLNQALRSVNASLGSFVHIVAHDLKGPTMNLSSLLELYEAEKPGSARERLVALVQQEVQRLSGTVQGLLHLIQMQHEAATMPATLVQWADVLALVQAEVAGLQRQQEGVLTTDFEAAPTIRYPISYLESILKNLVSNALKYRARERAPEVRIQTRRVGAQVLLTVTDNGQGIDLLRDQHRLFQPFTRLTTDGEGTGLGLHMIQTIIEQCGGSLEVSSTLGVGSTFTVILPEVPSA